MPRLAPLLALLAAAPTLADEPCAPVRPCEIPDRPGADPEAPADFAAEARALGALLGCQGAAPEGLDAAAVRAFCAAQARRLDAWRQRERAPREALLARARPARVPSSVVYPLAGADLLPALAAFPEARNLTTVSSLPAGEPRLLVHLRDPARLRAFLSAVSAAGDRLLRGEPAPAVSPVRGEPAGILPLLAWALAAEGQELVGLRYFLVEPAGTLRYLGPGELQALERTAGARTFGSCELAFVPRGAPAGTPPRFVRHLMADLSDGAVAQDPGPLAHLATKGRFAALLGRAGALAGADHGRLRALLLERAAFVISDGTGPSPEQARAAGLEVEGLRPAGPGRPPLVVLRRP